MSLQVPSYPNKHDADPLVDAYVWIAGIHLDFVGMGGSVQLRVHPGAGSAGMLPVDEPAVFLGQPFGMPPTDRFPSLAEALSDPVVAQAFGAIREWVYAQLVAHHPAFAGAITVP